MKGAGNNSTLCRALKRMIIKSREVERENTGEEEREREITSALNLLSSAFSSLPSGWFYRLCKKFHSILNIMNGLLQLDIKHIKLEGNIKHPKVSINKPR